MAELRQAALAVFLVILIEVGEFLLPFLVERGWVQAFPETTLLANTAQSVLVLVAAGIILLVVRRYTHRSLDRRIRESMETLAYLEGQRRRRRSLERGEWERRDEE